MKTVTELAREAGWTSYDSLDERLQRFHNLAIAQYRESLLAGSGEAKELWEFRTKKTPFRYYTADQIAAAVLREREACTVAAIDAIAFNGGTAQMETHVRAVIRGKR